MIEKKDKKLTKIGKLSKKLWNKLASEDAEFYILTKKGKEGRRWDKNEFLKEGQEQWEEFKNLLSNYDLKHIISKDKIALDMGCGVGRVTFAMARDFSFVIGVDVSETMIGKAKEYQKNLGIKNIKFVVNNGIDLSSISTASIDFLLSYLTLQHCPSSEQVLHYIKEFSRVMKSKGVCLFQVRVSPTFKRYIRFELSKKIVKIKRLFKKEYHTEDAFMGNWVYYPKIYKTVSQQFSAFYLVQTPIEIYENRFWNLNSEYERWRRSFFICIK